MCCIFVFLAAPLVAARHGCFNDLSGFPSLPWQGFTLDWFFNEYRAECLGNVYDRGDLLRGL